MFAPPLLLLSLATSPVAVPPPWLAAGPGDDLKKEKWLDKKRREKKEREKEKDAPGWGGETMPLALAVRTPEDLAFKTAAERQYLFFNLLAGGKQRWDRGDFAGAAERWEALLRTPGLPPELEALVGPAAKAAREKAGGAAGSSVVPMAQSPAPEGEPREVEPARSAEPSRPSTVVVTGTISGGGKLGPGGAVVMLRRADGKTPRPRARRVKAVVQRGKRFVPHVLAVPLGATVEFRNDDDIFHNVFSLSRPNNFDLGLYKSGASRDQTFDTPGVVNLLCNIHSSMNGYLYVVDTPWFGQANASGKFTIKNVPPGQYELEVWHERASKPTKVAVTVEPGMAPVTATVLGDKAAPAFVPDKSGKPRQMQLGY